MENGEKRSLAELCAGLRGHTLPRWEELPDFDLYMDQALALVGRYLGQAPGRGEKLLTSSMVNNYVKMGVMPAPVKKRYSRRHIAYLLVICVMKSVLSISDIRDILRGELVDCDEAFYTRFRELYAQMIEAVADAAAQVPDGEADGEEALKSTLLHAALRAQAEQAVAQEALQLLLGRKQ